MEVSFGIKTWDPVRVRLEEKTNSPNSNQIRFTASNSTYYTFILVIDYTEFDNLSPRPTVREMEITHGLNNLYTFSLQTPNVGYRLRYSTKYWLASSSDVINSEFPYLIPIKEGRMVQSKKNSFTKISNSFSGNKADTIYCMRRGLVTAVPRPETFYFRISDQDCLEVLHDDGTYMIYHFLNKKDDFTAPGRIVLPGQPIGTLSDSSYLWINLVKIEKAKNFLVSQQISYTAGKPGTLTFDEIDGKERSVYPREVITMEMNRKELKQANRNP